MHNYNISIYLEVIEKVSLIDSFQRISKWSFSTLHCITNLAYFSIFMLLYNVKALIICIIYVVIDYRLICWVVAAL